MPPINFNDVVEAADRIRGVAHHTPTLTSKTFDALTGAQLFFKCENLQRMGAFKFRGAYNRLAQLSPQERRGGVVAYSSGNHAQGVALAAQLLDIPAVIVMPRDAPEAKLNATRGYGAEVVLYERSEENRMAIAQAIARERGGTIVPPYDDERIAAGAGTAALELTHDAGPLDVIVAPCGGGGLLAGTCIAAHGVDPDIDLWGVEPAAGNDVQQSLAKNERVLIDVPKTIADGLQTQLVGEITFPILQAHAKGVVTVSDDELVEAMKLLFERMKLVVEPSGAAGFAAVLHERFPVKGRRIGIIISGGNVDPEKYAQFLSSGA